MTALADRDPSNYLTEPRPPQSPVDMRCSAEYDHDGSPVRCQLLAGHGTTHAIMYSDADKRRVLEWTGTEPAVDGGSDWMSRPWMRGYPFPAWFETDGQTAPAHRIAP